MIIKKIIVILTTVIIIKNAGAWKTYGEHYGEKRDCGDSDGKDSRKINFEA